MASSLGQQSRRLARGLSACRCAGMVVGQEGRDREVRPAKRRLGEAPLLLAGEVERDHALFEVIR